MNKKNATELFDVQVVASVIESMEEGQSFLIEDTHTYFDCPKTIVTKLQRIARRESFKNPEKKFVAMKVEEGVRMWRDSNFDEDEILTNLLNRLEAVIRLELRENAISYLKWSKTDSGNSQASFNGELYFIYGLGRSFVSSIIDDTLIHKTLKSAKATAQIHVDKIQGYMT